MSGFKTILHNKKSFQPSPNKVRKYAKISKVWQPKKPHVSPHTLIFVEHWNNSIFSIIIIIIIFYLSIYIKYLQLYPPSQLFQKHLFFAQYVKFQLGTTTEHWNKTQLLLVLAEKIEQVIIALEKQEHDTLQQILTAIEGYGIRTAIVPDIYQILLVKK
jgi:hypothetical protein